MSKAIDSIELEGVDEIDEGALQKVAQFIGSHVVPIGWPNFDGTFR